jgi:V/A-type H+-transporting ATPase subunit C
MILGVWRYAYGGAKVMALRGRLLTPEDYHFLLRARDLGDFLAYLRTTAYGGALAGLEARSPDLEAELGRRLHAELASAFMKVGRGLQGRERRFVGVLAQRLVAENLKVALRALHQRLSPERARRLLLPQGDLSSLDFEELLGQESVPALVEHLAATAWGEPLQRALPRYVRERGLFPLEMSLDLWVYGQVWEGLQGLSRPDRRVAARLLGTMIDITNIVWVGRFRDVYGFGGEETYQYLIVGGGFQEPRPRRDLAFAGSAAEMVALLPRRPYGALLEGVTGQAEVEARLAQHWIKTLERVSRRPPFQVGLPLTFLFLKELEVQNLITLITGRLLNLPADQVVPLLQWRGAGGGHV